MAEIEFPTYKISNNLLDKIEQVYESFFGKKPGKDSLLSEAIQWTSDYYIQNPEASSPWDEPKFKKAYLSYYLIMNHLRYLGVVSRLKQVQFFDESDRILEWGSGNGAFSLAFEHSGLNAKTYQCIEISQLAKEQHKQLQSLPMSWEEAYKDQEIDSLIFSYSFTELDELPNWAYKANKLLIMEPSTHQDARRLMKLRTGLIEKGYHVWAPCTHQSTCPLLTGSEKDWCHDNFNVEYPDFLKAVLLKTKLQLNKPAVTYLAVSKTPPTKGLSSKARVTGNTLKERGKTRQMICRGDKREFLAWFPKRQDVPYIPRGSLIELPEEIQEKSNEIRTKQDIKIIE